MSYSLKLELPLLLPKEKKAEDILYSGDDCSHTWVTCTHKQPHSKGDRKWCKKGDFNFRGSHEICKKCGRERWPNMWATTVTEILDHRKAVLIKKISAVYKRGGFPKENMHVHRYV